jgi:hypothetical protein
MLTPKETKYFINSNSHLYCTIYSPLPSPTLLVSRPRSSSSCPIGTVPPSCTTTHSSEPQSGSICRESSIPAQLGADIRQPPLVPRIRISVPQPPPPTPTAPTISLPTPPPNRYPQLKLIIPAKMLLILTLCCLAGDTPIPRNYAQTIK